MAKLTILAFGTADFLAKYSKGLEQDCAKFGYDCLIHTIPDEKNIGQINHHVFNGIVNYLETQEYDRVCLMDPECRIVKPFPDEWLDTDLPVVFRKVKTQAGTPEPKFSYWANGSTGNQLPCRIIFQPMILSKKDVTWIRLAHDLSVAASDLPNGEHVRNEMFLEIAIEHTKTKTINENCVYNRKANTTHTAVKGTWMTKDTVIQHPELHSLFDREVVSARGSAWQTSKVLSEVALECNVIDMDTVENINKAMWGEKTSEWLTFEQWHVQPSTGLMKFGTFKGEVYHHSIFSKIKRGIITPAVKKFNSSRDTQ